MEPDLENTELQSAYGVLGSLSKLLAKMLYVSEYGALLEAVYDISGLDKDINEDIDEAKTDKAGVMLRLTYAHFALQGLRSPSALESMSQRERAFIYASIDLRIEGEEKGLPIRRNRRYVMPTLSAMFRLMDGYSTTINKFIGKSRRCLHKNAGGKAKIQDKTE